MQAEMLDLERKFASIEAMLHPKSIAIVGATDRLQYGGRFLNTLLITECKARLYPVNPKRDAVFGVPCYHSVTEIPEPVDLAAIIVPASAVLDSLAECAAKGVKSAVVISAGFSELGTDEGRARQAALREIARESGMRICGPNCLGLANVAESVWATASTRISPETVALYSGIGLVSQSGATGFGPLIMSARDRGVGFRYIVSSGNEADLDSSDFVQYMLRDPEIKVVAILAEGLRDGPKFVETAEMALEMGKPLVLLKVGRSAAGSRAAASHTAALTGSDAVQDALFRQKGVVRVDDYDELIETANMFLKAKRPRGHRVGVVSHSGGIGSFLADKCGEEGLELPLLSDKTRDGLGAILGERGSAANPADVTGFASGETFPSILELMLDDDNLNLLVIASAGGDFQANTVVGTAEGSPKPVLFLWTGSIKETSGLPLLQEGSVPLFYLPGRCAKAARRLLDYHRVRDAILGERGSPDRPAPSDQAVKALRHVVAAGDGRPLSEYESKQVLARFGVPVTAEALCRDAEKAAAVASRIGYPVALKVMSPQVSHKTEAGAVRLNVQNAQELAAAHEELVAAVRSREPGARIEGVLVQEMVRGGVEVIAGVSRDPQFGPVLMLGLGGILVEALGAVAFRVCPIVPREAREMIAEVKGLSRLLAGYRGQPKADEEALVDLLVRVSEVAVEVRSEIASLDINPLAVLPEGRGVVALDALLVPDQRG